MTEVENKSPAPPVGEHPSAPEQAGDANTEPEVSQFPPQGPSGQPFPPPNFAFYNYPPGQQPPPGEGGNPDPNAQPNGSGPGPVPYPPPPSMMYPYAYPQPPPGYMPVSMAGMPLPGALVKPKRKQVKMACTNCAAACKRCDISRPCERCIKYGLTETCRDGQRKERKKGFKRGPYNKRKRQEERDSNDWEAAQSNPNGEWTPSGPSGSPFPGPPQQGGPFPPPPEGYYPAFYALAPPPGPGPQLVPVQQTGSPHEHPVEGHPDSHAEGHGQNGDQSQGPPGQSSFPPPHAQFVYPPLPPGSYPPFGYPFPGPPQQQPPQQPPQPQRQQPPSHPPPPPQQHSPQQSQPPQQQQQPQQPHMQPQPHEAASTKRKIIVEDDDKEDDDEDPPTPPRKKRGRRNSDGEWQGAPKRVAKSKADNTGPKRRSTRKQQHTPETAQAGTSDGQVDSSPVLEGRTHTGSEHSAPRPVDETLRHDDIV